MFFCFSVYNINIYMTFRSLLHAVKDAGLLPMVFKQIGKIYYEDDELDPHTLHAKIHNSYSHAIECLASLPSKQTDHAIVVNDQDHVCLQDHDETYAIDYTPWEDLIDARVLDDNISRPQHETLAHVLWEVTFLGFDTEAIHEAIEKLHNISKEDCVEISIEDFIEELDKLV